MLSENTLKYLKNFKLNAPELDLAIGCIENMRDSILEAIESEEFKSQIMPGAYDEMVARSIMLDAESKDRLKNSKGKGDKVVYKSLVFPGVAIELGLATFDS